MDAKEENGRPVPRPRKKPGGILVLLAAVALGTFIVLELQAASGKRIAVIPWNAFVEQLSLLARPSDKELHEIEKWIAEKKSFPAATEAERKTLQAEIRDLEMKLQALRARQPGAWKIVVGPETVTAYLTTKYKRGDQEYDGISAEYLSETFDKSTEDLLLRALKEPDSAKDKEKGGLIVERPGVWLPLLTTTVLPTLLLMVVLWFFFFRAVRGPGGPGNVLSFGRTRARLVSPERMKVNFGDVAGVDEAKDEVMEVVQFLKNPRRFRKVGGRIPRGILLVGPPGTGKTLLAKAIAGEAGVPFLSISGSDFVEMFVGVGAARVRDLFRQAREQAPSIVFIDEIDAVGRRRGSGLGGGHDEREQTLNQILVEMDGFSTEESVIVLAATNRPDILDPALLRPGRFDREVVIDLPDVRGREAILKVHAKKVKMEKQVNLATIAKLTPGCSGADLENIINEAAILAAIKGASEVSQEMLDEAREKVLWGKQRKTRVMDEAEKKITAYHEAGHALVSELLSPRAEPVHKVTIIPRGVSLGSTMRLPERDRYILQKGYFEANLAVAFGGRVAEELVFGEISHGARDDIKRATELARQMVCEFGMSEVLGPINYSDNEETLFLGREITRTRHISEQTAREIDREVKRLVDEAYHRAKDLLLKHREILDRLAAALLKHETLLGDEVRQILRGEAIRVPAPAEEGSNP